MSDSSNDDRDNKAAGPAKVVLYGLGLILVALGMLNAMPGIPGLDAGLRDLTGLRWLAIRQFPSEWFFPIAFMLMMTIVVLRHSMWRDWADETPAWRRFGLFMDLAMLAAAAAIALAYVIEIGSICLIDQFTGDRARLIAEALKIEKDVAELYGLPEPTSVEDPSCLNNLGGWLVLVMGLSVVVFLSYNVKVWGFPLVLVAILVAGYTIATIFVWYFHGPDDISKYLMTKLGGEPRTFADGRPKVWDVLVNNGSGILGRFMDVILNTVFPYIILGTLFGASAGGRSLIKLAFRWTRRLRGGPAHAAVVSSAMFGTISGGPIVNVLSTGVLTIPMMLKRGFSRTFAGGIEAAASSGGSIMPPVMGVAAFVLATLTSVPYSDIIVAAALPAIAYFFCLFLSVVFQARRQGIVAIGELTPDMHLNRQDKLNLIMIFGPILLILGLLLTRKEEVGCGFFGRIMGVTQSFDTGACVATDLPWLFQLIQNSAGAAGSAGWWAVALLLILLFVDPDVRAKPRIIFDSLSKGGQMIATLYLMFLAVSIIDFCLNFTGLPVFISIDVLKFLHSLELGQGAPVFFQFVALLLTMALAVLLGMGMPAVPAYVNVALLMGPVLTGLGVSLFTAHMFVFYFAIASAITPPVALAAFAAASITRADPMATGFSAVRSGIVMFVIPFVFAFYPELLVIPQAVLDPTAHRTEAAYLPGYDGELHIAGLMWLLARLVLALYLLASALARFDARRMPMWEMAGRLVIALAVINGTPVVHFAGIALAAGIIALHYAGARRAAAA